MNHQPFEQWLLSDEPLNTDQTAALHEHLQMCESCRRLAASWSEVRQLFQTTPIVQPDAGFSSRWQAHLRKYQELEIEKKQNQQTWMVFALTTIGTILLFVVMLSQLTSYFNSPSEIFVYWMGQTIGLLSNISALREVVVILFGTILSAIPVSYWLISLSILAVLCLIWILSLRHLYNRGGLFNESNR
jgi:predicted anti-sigma-YlaC factor YlaD